MTAYDQEEEKQRTINEEGFLLGGEGVGAKTIALILLKSGKALRSALEELLLRTAYRARPIIREILHASVQYCFERKRNKRIIAKMRANTCLELNAFGDGVGEIALLWRVHVSAALALRLARAPVRWSLLQLRIIASHRRCPGFLVLLQLVV